MRLIINADDFGLCESVNRAIIDVYHAGNLTSATLMVNMPGTEQAARLASENPGLGIGLHFCLTEGRPVLEGSTLADRDGNFYPRYEFLRRVYTGKIKGEDISGEFIAQLSKMQLLGLKPTHADSHQHLHMMPPIFNAIVGAAADAGIPLRVVKPNITAGLWHRDPLKYAKQRILSASVDRLIRKNTFKHNYVLVSIHDLSVLISSRTGYSDLFERFAQTDDVVELMIHPYIDAPDLHALYKENPAAHADFFQKCFTEYRILMEQPNLFKKEELITYADL